MSSRTGAWSVHGLHEGAGDVARYLRAEGGGVGAGEAEVEAGVDPCVFHLLDGGGEGGEVPLDAGQPGGGDGEAGGVSVEGCQHGGGGAADPGVRGGVFLKGGGGHQRGPGRVGGGADRGDRPPEVVVVFGVPDRDRGVGQGDVHLGQQPRVLGQREAGGLGELVSDPVPHRGGGVVLPEDRGLGLLGGAGGAGGAAQRLDLGKVLGVAGAGQRGRARWQELRGGGERERGHGGELAEQRRGRRAEEGRRGR